MKKGFLYILGLGAAILIAVSLFRSHAKKEADISSNNILVAYFSATGTTAAVANELAYAAGADLFEIKPEQVYTTEDLDWHNDQSRSSIEMKDRASRPKIASRVENMEQYNVVFVGFPIWWGREPAIIDTFMESYDFAGKTVIPFATSGSSDIGDTGANLQSLAPDATVLTGKRFPSDVSAQELKTWASEWL